MLDRPEPAGGRFEGQCVAQVRREHGEPGCQGACSEQVSTLHGGLLGTREVLLGGSAGVGVAVPLRAPAVGGGGPERGSSGRWCYAEGKGARGRVTAPDTA
ncbi:hypothetical protein GCM10018781_56610 [Kitasatospora indigofera]|uniref:Uncharacterized protein n=1 Tax=Kitasatospora indigofera TaxID=67307 RepID=A0A919G6X7_9ACTN|nr:hypothetical protein GCM10018781_56610 [Kitasatospora indigofera]